MARVSWQRFAIRVIRWWGCWMRCWIIIRRVIGRWLVRFTSTSAFLSFPAHSICLITSCPNDSNGTSQLCLPSTLNTSTTANSYTFFDALVSGSSSNLETHQDSVFTQAECTGCMYEMFKAAYVVLLPLLNRTRGLVADRQPTFPSPNTIGNTRSPTSAANL